MSPSPTLRWLARRAPVALRLRERFPGLYRRAATVGVDWLLGHGVPLLGGRRTPPPLGPRLPLPRQAMLEPTLRCNLDCRMCFQRGSRADAGDEWSAAEMREALEPLDLDVVRLIGGEPLLREDWLEWMAFFDRRGAWLSFCTNGTLLDGAALDRLARLSAPPLVVVSLNGVDEVYREVTGVDEYARVARALELAARRFPTGISTVCLEPNRTALAALVPRLRRAGALFQYLTYEQVCRKQDLDDTRARLQSELGWGSNCALDVNLRPEPGLDAAALRLQTEAAIAAGRRHDLPVFTLPPVWSRHLHAYCRGSARHELRLTCRYLVEPVLNVDPAGNLLHCEFIRHGFGNLREHPLHELWNDEALVAFRALLQRDNLLPVCQRCCKVAELEA